MGNMVGETDDLSGRWSAGLIRSTESPMDSGPPDIIDQLEVRKI